jgi:hypothetical protein
MHSISCHFLSLPFWPFRLKLYTTCLSSGEPSWQELGTDSGNNIAAVGKVEDVAAADTLKDVTARSVTVDAGDIEAADSVKDVELFE